MQPYQSRVVDLLDPGVNQLLDLDVEDARQRLLGSDLDAVRRAVRAFDGSFALVAARDTTVRLARSMDRPLRYFLAKRQEGPALYVADRIDTLHQALRTDGLADQFHPSYTRMVPAHYVVELQLVGCPDPSPTYTRFFTPERGTLSPDLDAIGRRYIGALATEIGKWLDRLDKERPGAPIGVAFSGGIDSGSVFLVTHHLIQERGLAPTRLKAFVLNLHDRETDPAEAPDVAQARAFLDTLGLSIYLEEIDGTVATIDVDETVRVIEDYKRLDVECAAVGLVLCRGIRRRYPDWTYLLDGDGGDENLKDYPIEENPELTIRSVLDNRLLYQEGWGVGRIKHSLTYSGGLSRSYVRTYAPARRHGFLGFSPYCRPDVMEVAEGIPFARLTDYDVPALYGLKGEIVRRGVRAVTGRDMPVFPKRRFQHGAVPAEVLHRRREDDEGTLRREFHALYA